MGEKTYTGKDIEVTFDLKRCIHAAECGRNLPSVFDVKQRPWVQPDEASADRVAEVVARCPSGALQFRRLDGGEQEAIPEQNTIRIMDKGPFVIHAQATLTDEKHQPLHEDTRLTLCRCGASANKPYCDNAHAESGFNDSGQIVDTTQDDDVPQGQPLQITLMPNGPLLLQGGFNIHSSDGQSDIGRQRAALCRCGASNNKPYCDGTHAKVGFIVERL